MRGYISTPLKVGLFLPACGTQQRAVTTAHQSDAALDQANDLAAKIMVLPGTTTNALAAEQALCDFTITMPRQPSIEGSHHQDESPATLGRKRKGRRTKTAAVDGAPKTVRGLQTDVGIGVERQFD